MAEPVFSRAELTLLLMIAGRYSQDQLYRGKADSELERVLGKLNTMLQHAPSAGALVHVDLGSLDLRNNSSHSLARDDAEALGLDDAEVAVGDTHLALTPDDIAAAALSLRDGLVAQNDALRARLEALKDVEKIKDENSRLHIELAVHGAPDAQEEIALLEKRLTAAEQENQSLRTLNSKLAKALHDERVARERVDPVGVYGPDPCRQPGIVQRDHRLPEADDEEED